MIFKNNTNIDIEIDNPDEDGVGEIIIKAPTVMLGYYGNPEATDSVLRDSWFHTGDLGKFDEDGFLFVTGRKKFVIVLKNGKKVARTGWNGKGMYLYLVHGTTVDKENLRL